MADEQTKPVEGADDQDDVRARAVADAEAAEENTPTPTQAELDRIKRGEHLEGKAASYKTRQAKAS